MIPEYQIGNAMGSAILGVIIGGLLGFGLMRAVSPSGAAKSPSDLGRKWLGWTLFAVCTALFSRFIILQSAERFVAWIGSLVIWGLIAYLLGWAYGRLFIKLTPDNSSTSRNFVAVPEVVKGVLGTAMTAIEYAHRNGIDERKLHAMIADGTLKSMLHDGALFVQITESVAGVSATPSIQTSRNSSSASVKVITPTIDGPPPLDTDSPAMPEEPAQSEDAWYEQALDELEKGQTVKATWARSLAEASGDDAKARGTYIRLRVTQLSAIREAECAVHAEVVREAERLTQANAERIAGVEAQAELERKAQAKVERIALAEVDQNSQSKPWMVFFFFFLIAFGMLLFITRPSTDGKGDQIEKARTEAAQVVQEQKDKIKAGRVAPIKPKTESATQTNRSYTSPDGGNHVGELKKVTHFFPDGGKYIGYWSDGKQNGQGTYTFPNGSTYVGEWRDGKRNGQGTYTFPDGSTYVGGWADGKRDGLGTQTWQEGGKHYGEWRNDRRNGRGTYFFPDGGRYVGMFVDDSFNGQGTYYRADGSGSQSGTWENNALVRGHHFDSK